MIDNEIDDTLSQDDEEIVVLADEEGKETEFRHIATLDYEGEWYMYLEPIEDGEEETIDADEDEIETPLFIFNIQTGADGNDTLIPVEDEELLDKLFNEFLKELDKQDE